MYPEHIAIFSKTPLEHKAPKKMVLKLQEAVIALKLKNCAFFTNQNDSLGHVTKPGWLKMTSHTANVIRELKYL